MKWHCFINVLYSLCESVNNFHRITKLQPNVNRGESEFFFTYNDLKFQEKADAQVTASEEVGIDPGALREVARLERHSPNAGWSPDRGQLCTTPVVRLPEDVCVRSAIREDPQPIRDVECEHLLPMS